MTNHFDVIVAGVGSMGASTCYHLARSGLSVLGLESRSIVNEDASHSGQTRIVRRAYFEHPDYVPLLKSAYRGWATLEQVTGKSFYHPVGLTYFGKQGHPLLQSVKNSSEQYDLPLKNLDQNDIASLLPDFSIPPHYETLLESEAGLVCTDQVIYAYGDLAVKHGATLKEYEGVKAWVLEKDHVEVETNKGPYTCDKLILTSGAGNQQLLPEAWPSMKVTRQLISWVKPKSTANLKLGELPCWVLAPDDEKGIFYGFPMLPESYGGPTGLKVAHHFPGENIDQTTDEALIMEKQKIEAIMADFMPGVFDGFIDITNCLYTYTTDDNFIIDLLPNTHQRVVVAAGFSGHGFKFVPVLGEILSDLAIKGKTDHPISFLKASRF